MLGGAYLCFEGVEKLIEAVGGHETPDEPGETAQGSAEIEKTMVSGAVRTDFILSAEIMAIALGEVTGQPLLTQSAALAIVALAITAAVYGVVGLIVKMDDIGLHLAERKASGVRAIGRGLVHAMPRVMGALSAIGVAAMIWVGGGILVHGLEVFHLDAIPHALHGLADGAAEAAPAAHGLVGWLVTALGSGLVGLVAGGAIVAALHLIPAKKSA
jgi:predicted DNA repair protein MutK